MSVYIYISYKITSINNVIRITDIHFTLLAYSPKQMHLPHCTCMSHCTAIVVHIDLTLLHISVKHNKCNFNATLNEDATAIYMPATNMLFKCYRHAICPKSSTCIYIGGMPIYMSHMKLFPSMMQPELLYTDKYDTDNDADCLTGPQQQQ